MLEWGVGTPNTVGRTKTTMPETVPTPSGLSATPRNSKSSSGHAINIRHVSNRRDASTVQ